MNNLYDTTRKNGLEFTSLLSVIELPHTQIPFIPIIMKFRYSPFRADAIAAIGYYK